MSIAGAIVVFVLCWWFCFFLALPFGVHRQEQPEVGHDAGAPKRPRLGLKALIATVGATVMTAAIAYVIEADLISFYTPPA